MLSTPVKFKNVSKSFLLQLQSNLVDYSFSYTYRISRETNIFYPLIRTHTFACHGVRNVMFSESLTYLLNELSVCGFRRYLYEPLYEAPGDLLAKFKQTQYLKSD